MKSTSRTTPQGNPIPTPSTRTKGTRPAVSRGLELAEGEQVFIGIDVHKASYSVAVYSCQRGELVRQWKQPADAFALIDSIGPFRQQIVQIVYEAGPTGFELARALLAHEFAVAVVAPSLTPEVAARQEKCDRRDAARLAFYASKGTLHPVAIPTREQEGERDLVRLREMAVDNAGVQKVQIKSLLLKYSVSEPEGLKNWSVAAVKQLLTLKLPSADATEALQLMVGELYHLNERIKLLTRKIAEIGARPEHQADVARLRTIPGIGRLTAILLICELFDPGRFATGEQVSKYLGLAPCVSASGQTVRQAGRIEGGNKRLRTALVEAAWRWVRRDDQAGIRFRELACKTASKKKAIVAMARRLGLAMWRMLTRGEGYQGFQKCRAEAA